MNIRIWTFSYRSAFSQLHWILSFGSWLFWWSCYLTSELTGWWFSVKKEERVCAHQHLQSSSFNSKMLLLLISGAHLAFCHSVALWTQIWVKFTHFCVVMLHFGAHNMKTWAHSKPFGRVNSSSFLFYLVQYVLTSRSFNLWRI